LELSSDALEVAAMLAPLPSSQIGTRQSKIDNPGLPIADCQLPIGTFF
jgi:hypothetical protein